MDSIASFRPVPGTTNTGQMNYSGPGAGIANMSRIAAVRLSLRNLTSG